MIPKIIHYCRSGGNPIQKDRISVIIPVYNVEKYLAECVDSIIKQTYQNLEIVLVDDGSTDNSSSICDEYEKIDPRIKVIHQENGGLSAARNKGLDIATGRWISFVDSDDTIEDDMLELLLDQCIKNHLLLSVCGIEKFYDETGKKFIIYSPDRSEIVTSEQFLESMTFPAPRGDSSSAWNKLYHRSLWENQRFPVGRLHEDLATIYKIVDEVDEVGLIKKNLYHYRIRKNSIQTMADKAYVRHRLGDLKKGAREFLIWTESNHPKIKSAAGSLYIRTLLGIENTATRLRDNQLYKEERKELVSFLKSHKESYRRLGIKDKIKITLLYSHLYFPIYSIYLKFKT